MAAVLDERGLATLLEELRARGYQLIGPTVRDGAIVHAEISTVDDLPRGVTDEQAPGRYRLTPGGDGLLFGFAAAATSWKPFLYPSYRTVWTATDASAAPEPAPREDTRRAFLGVRSCDLHAIAVQDTVLSSRGLVDLDYAARRARTFVVAVTCGRPGGTCFCVSMGTGPRPSTGYDLTLTELLDAQGHRFLTEAGTAAGEQVLAALPGRPPTGADAAAADGVVAVSAAAMGRTVDTTEIRDLLYDNAEHPRWADVASRCLSCTNCTMVCPTCFCVSTTDTVDLTGAVSRSREWDSCFLPGHSALHGEPVRRSTETRYRQWLTHKFGSWIDQFGTSGCVGCGRCLTWCPAGIDVTEELAAIRGEP
jgi:sulfhydrogenase subunit beta (sulfur reductase)